MQLSINRSVLTSSLFTSIFVIPLSFRTFFVVVVVVVVVLLWRVEVEEEEDEWPGRRWLNVTTMGMVADVKMRTLEVMSTDTKGCPVEMTLTEEEKVVGVVIVVVEDGSAPERTSRRWSA
jgi:hypothetical protein